MAYNRTKCEECEGRIIREKVDFSIYGVSLGRFEAEVCSKCGETLFDESTSDKIDKVAKERGLWGLEARTRVGVAGDGLVIRINKKIAQFMGIKKGEEVTLIPESKHQLKIEI